MKTLGQLPNLKELRRLHSQENSDINKVYDERCIKIHPKYSNDVREGVVKELERCIAQKFCKKLGGIPMGFENVQILTTHGWFFSDDPFLYARIRATFFVFLPRVGAQMEGQVKKTSKGHLGCLVYDLFNVMVVRPAGLDEQSWQTICGRDKIRLQLTFVDLEGHTSYLKASLMQEEITATEKPRRKVFLDNAEDDDSGVSTTESIEEGGNLGGSSGEGTSIEGRHLSFEASGEEEEEEDVNSSPSNELCVDNCDDATDNCDDATDFGTTDVGTVNHNQEEDQEEQQATTTAVPIIKQEVLSPKKKRKKKKKAEDFDLDSFLNGSMPIPDLNAGDDEADDDNDDFREVATAKKKKIKRSNGKVVSPIRIKSEPVDSVELSNLSSKKSKKRKLDESPAQQKTAKRKKS